MTPRDRVTAFTGILVLVSMVAVAQVRDAPKPPPREAGPASAGTSSIAGTILTDADPPRPVRRATVLLNWSGEGRTAVTDDAGRFVFTGLPAGRYNLSVMKRGWTRMPYGAKAPGRPGTSVPVAAGERATITMRMPRPAAITGTVLDENGQPQGGLVMRVMQYRYTSGERRLAGAPATSFGPDERGHYRIFGLAPGEYYVVASGTRDVFSPGSDVHFTSDVDVQQAIKAIEGGPGVPLTDVPQRRVAAAPVYYPGTASLAQATPITVRAGEERAGVDFVTQYVTAARIDGTVTGLDGAPPAAGTQVSLVSNDPNIAAFGFDSLRSTRTDAGGTFGFAGVAPGSYALLARAANPSSWASADVDVQGDDLHGVTLALQGSLTVSGTVTFDGAGQPPAFTAVSVALQPLLSAGGVTISSATNANADASGHFSISGVSPGRYRLSAAVRGTRATWVVRASSLGGQASLDTVVDVRSSLSDGLVTLTDRTSDVSGQAPPDSFVILFPVNQAQWAPPSRRIIWNRVAADGSFTSRSVPPGDYYIVAVNDVEPGQWLDPTYLQGLIPSATKITIGDGEKKTIEIRGGG
jgi:protocatechuate 3,4-dioxygenase beta subunit